MKNAVDQYMKQHGLELIFEVGFAVTTIEAFQSLFELRKTCFAGHDRCIAVAQTSRALQISSGVLDGSTKAGSSACSDQRRVTCHVWHV